MTPATPYDLLRSAASTDPSRPLLTFLDERTGERSELSVATFDNWVSKTANLLVDGLAAAPGGRVALDLPLHWQSVVWLHACWATGMTAALGVDAADADVVVLHADDADGLRAAQASGADTLALALRPLAMPGTPPPPPVADYDVEVRAYGDRFTAYAKPTAAAEALQLPAGHLTAAELLAAGERAADAWGRPQHLLTAWPLTSEHGVLAAAVVPLLTGGSTVLARGLDDVAPDRLRHLVDTEQIDAVAGVELPDTGVSARAVGPAH
jgi:uncharacterized protein (TIGR03089 family)